VAGQQRFALRPKDALEDFAVPLPPPQYWIERFHCEYESEN
jgi:hypothetical protein